MNILIVSMYGYNSYSRGIMPDVLQTQIDLNPGAKIYYLTDSGSFDVNYFNIGKRPEITYLDKVGVKNTLKLIEGDFHWIKMSEIIEKEDRSRAQEFIETRGAVDFDLFYENFDLGAATLSTYISRTRDRELQDVEKQGFVNELAVNALIVYLAITRFLKNQKVDLVYNFNGRQDYVRAVMRATMAQNIDCLNIERTRLQGNIDFYRNTFPHDPFNKFQLVEKYWRESLTSEEEKWELGAEFYKRQKSGESVVFPSYTQKMKKGEIPQEFLNGKKNIVIFNSSDDEVVAFGDTFKYPLFEDQNQGLEYLVDLVGKKISSHNLIIRMHPNLEKVEFGYVKRIKDLHQRYPNIFVVLPESTVDSYSLLDLAEKVITFGSTMGLEANFLRKPVILLGKGFFYFADYAFKPENREEIDILLGSDLKPKPLLDTIKVGFYLQRGGVKTKYYNEEKYGEGILFKGKRVHFYSLTQRIKAKITKLAYDFLDVRLKFNS